MTPYIEEALRMLRLAEADHEAFAILRAHPGAPLSPTCFHAQQCVEKALKAVLMSNQIHFRRTHDLDELIFLLEHAHIVPPFAADIYQSLGPFAVELRYDELLVPLVAIETVEHIANGTLNWAREQVRGTPTP